MRRWVIILVGAVAALTFDVVWALPELSIGRPDIVAILYRDVASLAARGLTVYAAFVLFGTTAITLIDLRRVRSRLAALRAPTQRDWFAAFAGTGLTRLAVRILDLAPADGSTPGGKIILQSRFATVEAHREIARLHRNWLVRVHFFTALGILLTVAALGLAQDHALVLDVGAAIPTGLIVAAVIALIALGVLGRVAVEAAAETLLDAIGKLPFERLDLALLRALIVSSENRVDVVSVGYGSEAPLEPTTELLTTRLERDHQTLWEAITRITENTEVLTRVVQTISELPGQSTMADPDGLADVKLAIDRLTATVNRLPDVVQLPVSGSEETPPRLSSREGDLGRDLRALLSEFD